MNSKELREFNRDTLLVDTLLQMNYSSNLLGDYIGDMKIELKEAQRIKRSIEKKLLKGKVEYKRLHGKEVNLEIKK